MFSCAPDKKIIALLMMLGAFPGLGIANTGLQIDEALDQSLKSTPLQDPTRPAQFRTASIAVKDSRKEPQLSSILNSDGRRVAMINNRPMLEGSAYNGIRVARIMRQSVDISYADGTKDTLTLQDKRVKKEFK